MGLVLISDVLSCPVCAAVMHVSGGSLDCDSGHRFDISREGYVNMLSGGAKPSTADTPAMVAARRSFLGSGHFAPLLDTVASTLAVHAAGADAPILDAGGGTGEYLAAALRLLPDRCGICIDLSRPACKVSARTVPRAGVIIADVWGALPIRDARVGAVLSVFAPRNAPEFARVLHPRGALIVVTPTDEHLGELVGCLGLITVDPDKDRRLDAAFSGLFALVSSSTVRSRMTLDHDAIRAVVGMGPSASHLASAALEERLLALDKQVTTTLSARVAVYRPLISSDGVT